MNEKYEYESARELIKKLKHKKTNLVDFIIDREVKLFGVSKEQIILKLKNYLKTMEEAIKKGISKKLNLICLDNEAKKINKNKIRIMNTLEYEILISSIAIAEYNCSMGKIVACPTAGSCGILPGVLFPIAKRNKFSEELLINALLVAGEVGRLIAIKTSISGSIGGCMVECGIGAAITAAALVYLFNGNIEQIFNSAALALKNNLGLICDPVAGLVEVPCVKRNGFKALEALTAAQLALVGVKSVIPFDEVVEVVKEVSDNIPKIYKETSKGGLATTKTGLKYRKKLLR
ncbi:MAG TPA: L-serine ammonia-lyase, iron-sulfur-dependent, subunit alpha [bacterium]|nr:L-serine ammonia-lyase, iron-sulfur-dependent, subunit alpha [bacterium]HOL48696.1 L-serine ammonia-lyase, iron-sulfur-dependent, subunit alpha [bacterium]HPQ18095.1 L-serine ammonia-lyase, iron-sulfur-dependent, subunit alpha [bacterium]